MIERESVDHNNTENENSNTKKKPMTLTDLPEELLLYLATFLPGRDVVQLCHVNRYLFYTFGDCSHLWQKASIQDKLYHDHAVETIAKQYAHDFGDDHHYDSVSYMLHMHVKCNWQNGVNQMVPPIPVKNIFGWGYDSQSLVALDNVSSCYKPDWVILVWDMVAKKLHKHPWDPSLSQPMHVDKVLVHEEVVVFHYDDINGQDVVFALDIGNREAIKILWCEKAKPNCKWLVPDVGGYLCGYDKTNHKISIYNISEGPVVPKFVSDFHFTPFTFSCEHPWLAVAHHCTRSGGKEEVLLINALTGEEKNLVCPPSHQNSVFNPDATHHKNSLGKILLHDGKVYGLFAHESTLVWDGKTGELLQKISHEGGLRFKIALSCDFVALALEARDKVIVYKPCPASNTLLEFAKFDVNKLVPGCDNILDAQLVANCLVLYVSPRDTHKLQLIMVPLLSNNIDELSKKIKVVDVSSVLDLWNKFDRIIDSKLYVTPTLAMIFGDKQFQIIDFVSDVIA